MINVSLKLASNSLVLKIIIKFEGLRILLHLIKVQIWMSQPPLKWKLKQKCSHIVTLSKYIVSGDPNKDVQGQYSSKVAMKILFVCEKYVFIKLDVHFKNTLLNSKHGV